MRPETLVSLLAARASKQQVALVSHLETGEQTLVFHDRTAGDLELDETAISAARNALNDDKSGRLQTGNTPLFAQVFNPPKRMIIVGAVHIAQPLVILSQTSGYETIIVDPRGAFATRDRFPGVTMSEDWPDDALKNMAIDNRTAIVTLTHDPKLDDPALRIALRSEAFYVGSLGSKRTHAGRVERLTEAGYTGEEIERIHAPIGLDINAKSPAEIAVSIMAQITQILRNA
ncbi:MAG: xanthine dehydrogenase [Alphaproteobacteria bacterium]|nr:xanthine dehydrogenase [Alphaproteobacteria bacterium]HCP00399.1 xanthine dehydrogenase [Rhodospirillaceae bacterium]|tara:strand:- start:265 stop:957 length:693 start_codon:yes stop_codon:yes gene_type:complete